MHKNASMIFRYKTLAGKETYVHRIWRAIFYLKPTNVGAPAPLSSPLDPQPAGDLGWTKSNKNKSNVHRKCINAGIPCIKTQNLIQIRTVNQTQWMEKQLWHAAAPFGRFLDSRHQLCTFLWCLQHWASLPVGHLGHIIRKTSCSKVPGTPSSHPCHLRTLQSKHVFQHV